MMAEIILCKMLHTLTSSAFWTPEVEENPDNVVLNSRQGVAAEYLAGKAG